MSSFPSQIHQPYWHVVLLFLLATLFASPASSSHSKVSYADHCNSIVHQSIPTGIFLEPDGRAFHFSSGYFSGGDKLLGPDLASSPSSSPDFSYPGSFYFYAERLQRTKSPGVIQLDGTFHFSGRAHHTTVRYSKKHRGPIASTRRKSLRLELSGFWSESSGKLCMVGNGFVPPKRGNSALFKTIFKLNYPKSSNISTSLISGTIESLDTSDSRNHFDRISIVAYAQKNYSFTQIPRVRDLLTHVRIPEKSLGLEVSAICYHLQSLEREQFLLEYGRDCSKRNCDPLSQNLGFSPTFMALAGIQCSGNGMVYTSIRLSNDSNYYGGSLLVPGKSLVAEGFWDQEKRSLCLVACPKLSSGTSPVDAHIGNCSIALSLSFPRSLSITIRSTAIGRIWAHKDKSNTGYLNAISFRKLHLGMDSVTGLEYEYTTIGTAKKACLNNQVLRLGNRTFPDGSSVRDMSFRISFRNREGQRWSGSADLLSLGSTIYSYSFMAFARGNNTSVNKAPSLTSTQTDKSLLNVSYRLPYYLFNSDLNRYEGVEVAAEGIYNVKTGILCMAGCRYLSSSVLNKQIKPKDSMDCEILMNIQLYPLNPQDGEQYNGTIVSTRAKSDPLYFEPLEVSTHKMYSEFAVASVQRMDVEIVMVIVSLTLLCFFVRLQILHVKKQPDVLPSISISMLAVLIMGHIIPILFSNFEVMFFTSQSDLTWSRRWLEVNAVSEVIMRVITMVAFFLMSHLLYLAWTARSTEENQTGLWAAERKALKLCLPLYFSGAVIACFVSYMDYETTYVGRHYAREGRYIPWEVLTSYAGLILDGFLLPQIILNMVWGSKAKALAPAFYIGTTTLRALPHLYDAYRSWSYIPHLSLTYIYASRGGDFYSFAWDIIIPLGVVLFPAIIYLQQRFGGACLVPQRFRKSGGLYEIASVVGP